MPLPMSEEPDSAEALKAAKKKNAEAQASFRARRQTYIKSLEETVVGLEGVVKEMQKMCKRSTDEAKLLRERVAVLEGVIDEMTSRIERSAAISANKSNHCDSCRFLPPSRHCTPQPRDYRHSMPNSGYTHHNGAGDWPREPYHPALGNAQGLSNPSLRLDTGHLERHSSSQQGAESAGTSSHTHSSSATSSIPSREQEGYRDDGMPPALFNNMFTTDVYPNSLELSGGMSEANRFPTGFVPANVDSLSQQANYQAFVQQHLESGPDQSQVTLPQSQTERDLLTNFARSFGSSSMHRLEPVQPPPLTPSEATSANMTMDYMFPSKDQTGPYMGPSSSTNDLSLSMDNPPLSAFAPNHADPNSAFPQLRAAFIPHSEDDDGTGESDEMTSPMDQPRGLGKRPMNGRRASSRSDGSMADPIAACSASGSSKVNGLPAKVARCEKTLREVQLALQSVKNEAEEARNTRPGGSGLKRRRLSESDFTANRRDTR